MNRLAFVMLFAYLPFMAVSAHAQGADRLYALLVNGGRNRLINHERYWNDCALLYCMLRHAYHVPKRNITVLISDGGNPDPDMLRADQTGFISSPTDLDDDGLADVDGAATSDNLHKWMNDYAQKLSPNDRLFVFIIDHGGESDSWNMPYVWLWDNEQLNAQQLGSMLNQLHVGSTIVLLGQCFAGGFAPYLQGEGRVVLAACQADERSWASKTKPYDEFVYHWTCAIAGHDEYGFPVDADVDDDGYVTMDEAFVYAQRHDDRPETPMMVSQPESLAWQWLLGGLKSDVVDIASPVQTGRQRRETAFDLSGKPMRQKSWGISLEKGRKILTKP